MTHRLDIKRRPRTRALKIAKKKLLVQRRRQVSASRTLSMAEERTKYAFDPAGRLVDADDVQKNDGPFTCICPGDHRVKFVPPGKANRVNYFAHIESCMGGESEDHVYCKMLLRDYVGRYEIPLVICPDCKVVTKKVSTVGLNVSLERMIEGEAWRYDCIACDGEQPVLAMEVWKTHKTTREKIDSTKARGLDIAEMSCDDIKEALQPSHDVVLIKNNLAEKTRCPECAEERKRQEAKKLLEEMQKQRDRPYQRAWNNNTTWTKAPEEEPPIPDEPSMWATVLAPDGHALNVRLKDTQSLPQAPPAPVEKPVIHRQTEAEERAAWREERKQFFAARYEQTKARDAMWAQMRIDMAADDMKPAPGRG